MNTEKTRQNCYMFENGYEEVSMKTEKSFVKMTVVVSCYIAVMTELMRIASSLGCSIVDGNGD